MAVTSIPASLSSRHLPALDGLRAIAIFIVMLHHTEFLLPGHSGIMLAVKNLFYTGWSGVDLFFVLSGFLITGILIDTRQAKNYFSSFYARRVLRIFPLYYLVLTAIVVFAHLYYRPWFDRFMAISADQVFYFFYIQNWRILLKDTVHWNLIGHFWSLAVEEQFYLVWPACVWLIPKRYLMRVAITGVVLALALRIALFAWDSPSISIVQNTFARMDALLAGACCAIIARNDRMLEAVKPWLVPVMIFTAAGMAWIDLVAGELRFAGFFTETFGLSFLAIGYSALLLWSFLGREQASVAQRILKSRPLQSMGKYSYGIYVLHVPLLAVLYVFLTRTGKFGVSAWISVLSFVTLIVASYFLAMASYELFERHFLRLKSLFKPRFEEAPVAPFPAEEFVQ